MRMTMTETTGITPVIPDARPGSLADRDPQAEAHAASAWEPSSWPFNPDDVTPLEWWRTMPADHLGDVQRLVLRGTLQKICVVQGRQWLSAMRGDAAACIAIAVGSMPIDQITLKIDLAMSALALCALDGNAGAAMVLAHILLRTPLDHPFAKELSVSWPTLNLRRASNATKHPAEAHTNLRTLSAPNAGAASLGGGMQR